MRPMIQKPRWIATTLCGLLIAGCAGSTPTGLGVTNGQLADCPDSPNCVSSQAKDDAHRVAPLRYSGEAKGFQEKLVKTLEGDASARVVEARPGYVRAEFRSRIMGFVDDAEFSWQNPERIEVRSASRLGYGDFGVNRARVEHLRTLLETVANGARKQ